MSLQITNNATVHLLVFGRSLWQYEASIQTYVTVFLQLNHFKESNFFIL